MRGDEAFRYLDIYVDSFTSRNGFNLNGQQRGEERHSGFSYRPFTLDANFGASQAIHEMLLQSWGDTIRIFPCLPKQWTDVSFENLRGEGGFIVSAERRQGKTVSIEITAMVDRVLRLHNPFGESKDTWNRDDLITEGDEIIIQLKAGAALEGTL